MAKVVLFGAGQVAETVYDYLTYDSDHEVVAFTVNREWVDKESLFGKPIIPFEDLLKAYPPGIYKLFTALSFKGMNTYRQHKYFDAKRLGYSFITYISSKASVWPSVRVGENTFIMEQNVIQPHVTIGNNVILWSGNHVGHHSMIGDHTFIASHAVVSGNVSIGQSCFIGVNATIRDNVSIAHKTLVGAGALVLKDTAEGQVFAVKQTPIATYTSDQLRSI